jgi:hypothetical protein
LLRELSYALLSREEKLVLCENQMVHELSPEELERFAEAEQSAKDAQTTIALLRQKVMTRELRIWPDEVIKNELSPEDRDFARRAYPEEIIELGDAIDRLGQATKTKAELIAMAGARMPSPE